MLKRLVETLAIGAVGGMALGLTGVPAGYLSGSILAVMIAALSGRSVGLPVPFVQAIFIFLGTSLGGVVTPEMLKGMATYPLSIAILIVAVFCVSISAAVYLRVVHRWDKINAYLASLPGAMSQVLALGIELGAYMRAIAIVQSARVVIVAIGVPAGI
jgi:membrane AbrB-like protein